jgi:hypothetical protein
MTLPANIRVNTSAPFPSMVKATAPAAIKKQNGIWTVSISYAGLGVLPQGVDPTKVIIAVFNTITGTFQQTSLAGIQSGGLLTTPVTHAQSPYAVLVTDFFILADTTGGTIEIDLPFAAQRGGVALSLKDYKGNANVNNITIRPQVGETIDNYTNAAPLILQAKYDGVKLLPITGGYIISP